jgi:hypothetical protein
MHPQSVRLKVMKAKLSLLVLVLLTFVGGYSIGSASVEPYQVTINGNPSKLKVGHDKDSLIVPLALPVTSDQEDWNISLLRDEKTHKLDVKMTSIKRKLRGRHRLLLLHRLRQLHSGLSGRLGSQLRGGLRVHLQRHR